MRTCHLEGESLLGRLQILEREISHVRKTKIPTTFTNLIFPEEVSIIRQAKREHHPVSAEFSGKAFINLDDEDLFSALQNGTIDSLIEDTPLLKPFIQETIEIFKPK